MKDIIDKIRKQRRKARRIKRSPKLLTEIAKIAKERFPKSLEDIDRQRLQIQKIIFNELPTLIHQLDKLENEVKRIHEKYNDLEKASLTYVREHDNK